MRHSARVILISILCGCTSSSDDTDTDDTTNPSSTSVTSDGTSGSSASGSTLMTTSDADGAGPSDESTGSGAESETAGSGSGSTNGDEQTSGESSGPEASGSSSGDGEAESSTGSTSATDESSTGEAGDPVELFSCALEPSCSPITGFPPPIPEDAAECVAELVASGRTGTVRWTEESSDLYEHSRDFWIVFLGDGTALVQRRVAYCDSYGYYENTCEQEPYWSPPEETELCDVVAPVDDCNEECDADECPCIWSPNDDWLVNCRRPSVTTCADLL